MADNTLKDAKVVDHYGLPVGQVVKISERDNVEIRTPSGQHFWVKPTSLAKSQGQWCLLKDFTAYTADNTETAWSESDIDEAADDTFPASDPPSFTLGDEGKGR